MAGSPVNTIIDGTNTGRIFNVTGDYSLTIENLALKNGVSSGGNGGAINYGGDVTITSSFISDCSAGTDGGAIYTEGAVTADSSTFTNCSAVYNGGAIEAAGGVTLTSSTFTDCSITDPEGWGGAVFVPYYVAPDTPSPGTINPVSSATVTFSTFTNCTGGWDGGAVFVQSGGLTVSSSRSPTART